MSSETTILYDTEEVQAAVRRLGSELDENLGEEPLLISLLNESVLFIADLVRSIERPIRYEFIQVGYSADDTDGEILNIEYPMPIDLNGADVILVRDLATTGVIESYLVPQFLQHGARRVRVAALLDVPDRRTTDFETDFRALTAPADTGTLVGYGMKHEGRHGNKGHISQLPSTTPGA